MRRAGVIAGLLVVAYAGGAAVYAWQRSGAPVTQFCADTGQLQEWRAQDLQPGIDQNEAQHPNLSYVQGFATYLAQLAAEATQPIHDDLAVWATFTSDLAGGADHNTLAERIEGVRAAVTHVES